MKDMQTIKHSLETINQEFSTYKTLLTPNTNDIARVTIFSRLGEALESLREIREDLIKIASPSSFTRNTDNFISLTEEFTKTYSKIFNFTIQARLSYAPNVNSKDILNGYMYDFSILKPIEKVTLSTWFKFANINQEKINEIIADHNSNLKNDNEDNQSLSSMSSEDNSANVVAHSNLIRATTSTPPDTDNESDDEKKEINSKNISKKPIEILREKFIKNGLETSNSLLPDAEKTRVIHLENLVKNHTHLIAKAREFRDNLSSPEFQEIKIDFITALVSYMNEYKNPEEMQKNIRANSYENSFAGDNSDYITEMQKTLDEIQDKENMERSNKNLSVKDSSTPIATVNETTLMASESENLVQDEQEIPNAVVESKMITKENNNPFTYLKDIPDEEKANTLNEKSLYTARSVDNNGEAKKIYTNVLNQHHDSETKHRSKSITLSSIQRKAPTPSYAEKAWTSIVTAFASFAKFLSVGLSAASSNAPMLTSHSALFTGKSTPAISNTTAQNTPRVK